MTTQAGLKVGRTDAGYLVQVTGHATLQESPGFKAFVSETLRRLPNRKLVIDVGECTYMDSTFLGCLVALHKQFGKDDPPRFVIAAPDDVRQKLFESCQLHRVLNILPERPELQGEPCDLDPHTPDPASIDFRRHIIDCHRLLAEIDSPYAEEFRELVEQLTRELEEQSV